MSAVGYSYGRDAYSVPSLMGGGNHCPEQMATKEFTRESAGREFSKMLRMIGSSSEMRVVSKVIARAAPLDLTVLVTGETGTGKELAARALHSLSRRASKPFIVCHCNELTETLSEKQLFGNNRGAYTGAAADEPGFVRAAEGGTLLLDEVGDLPLSLQGKLLRVLQEREVTPVGSSRAVKVDVRFVAATNKDLAKEVRDGRFRMDLYQRLRVLELALPPLRKRREDIPELVRHFILERSREMCLTDPPLVTGTVLDALTSHDWPGNVRELENEVARLVFSAGDGGVITETGSALGTRGEEEINETAAKSVRLPLSSLEWHFERESARQFLRRVQRDALEALMESCGDARGAARMLGMTGKRFNEKRRRLLSDGEGDK